VAPRDSEDAASDRLVARFQSGDRDAFGELYLRYFDRVYHYLRIVLRDAAQAEDSVQQVFLQALEALPRYEFRGRPFRAWLFVLVRHHALRQLSTQGRVQPVAQLDDRPGDAEPHDAAALHWITDHDLVLLVERLPLPQRQVLLLRFMLDLPATQVASILGYTPENVRKLQARALAFLRERLAGLGREPRSGGRVRMYRQIRPAVVTRHRRFALRG
jgi:RNA polymerase sigma-70 factor (ECF subfamily)